MRYAAELRLLGIFLALLASATASADTARIIPFQGRLANGDGTTVADGPFDVVFMIYDAPTAGNLCWSEPHTAANGHAVPVQNGQVNVLLGAIQSLDAANPTGQAAIQACPESIHFTPGAQAPPPWYLGIKVENGKEMVPRQQLVPAFHAREADVAAVATMANLALAVEPEAITQASIAQGAVGSDEIANGSIELGDLAPATVSFLRPNVGQVFNGVSGTFKSAWGTPSTNSTPAELITATGGLLVLTQVCHSGNAGEARILVDGVELLDWQADPQRNPAVGRCVDLQPGFVVRDGVKVSCLLPGNQFAGGGCGVMGVQTTVVDDPLRPIQGVPVGGYNGLIGRLFSQRIGFRDTTNVPPFDGAVGRVGVAIGAKANPTAVVTQVCRERSDKRVRIQLHNDAATSTLVTFVGLSGPEGTSNSELRDHCVEFRPGLQVAPNTAVECICDMATDLPDCSRCIVNWVEATP